MLKEVPAASPQRKGKKDILCTRALTIIYMYRHRAENLPNLVRCVFHRSSALCVLYAVSTRPSTLYRRPRRLIVNGTWVVAMVYTMTAVLLYRVLGYPQTREKAKNVPRSSVCQRRPDEWENEHYERVEVASPAALVSRGRRWYVIVLP